jgi:hypothetical protein
MINPFQGYIDSSRNIILFYNGQIAKLTYELPPLLGLKTGNSIATTAWVQTELRNEFYKNVMWRYSLVERSIINGIQGCLPSEENDASPIVGSGTRKCYIINFFH